MTQLYQRRWETQEGEIFKRDEHGNLTDDYTPGFILWAKRTNDLTDEQWKKGFYLIESDVIEHKALSKNGSAFPPSYAEFLGLCQQQTLSENGFLNPDDAYRHASRESGKHRNNREWHDTLVYKAASEVGIMELASEPRNKIINRFESAYRELFKRYLTGERFSFPKSHRIEKKESEPLSKSENSERMKNLIAQMWGA